ncbi:MAG: hypothetical protein NTV01_15455 [Bacteroidia bacterium]|nr:hypothetical protein [Bacteroidia bacterium]
MSGIKNLTIIGFEARINRFDPSYVQDWDSWLNVHPDQQAAQFGLVLRKWQACRPNRMRRTRIEQIHEPPYLEDLLAEANPYLRILDDFDIRLRESFSREKADALSELWRIFQHLPYQGRALNGLASVTGISKAVLLLTRGRVGPALDSTVRANLNVRKILSADQWIDLLKIVNEDVQLFEAKNGTTLNMAAPKWAQHLNSGRIYDMALGPGD